jgi:hypothetical protein
MDDELSTAQLSDPLISTLFLSYRRDSLEAVVLCNTEVEGIAARVTFHPIITTASA